MTSNGGLNVVTLLKMADFAAGSTRLASCPARNCDPAEGLGSSRERATWIVSRSGGPRCDPMTASGYALAHESESHGTPLWLGAMGSAP